MLNFLCTEGHETVNYKKYYENCMMDVCSSKTTKVVCRSLSDYAIACSKLGVIIENWRTDLDECSE